jgi:hypothetical protein
VPWGFQSSTILSTAFWSFLIVCPIHLRWPDVISNITLWEKRTSSSASNSLKLLHCMVCPTCECDVS